MKLYHGSNVRIEKIDLYRGRVGKDFGRGFYLSSDRQQAAVMAQTAVEREGNGVPFLNCFDFDDSCLTNGSLRVKIFEGYSQEWAEFIIANRSNRIDKQVHDYDIVYGPIADDRVGLQLRRFQNMYISLNQLVEELQYVYPTFQYFFGTEQSLEYLKKSDE